MVLKARELSHYGPSICVKFHGDYVVAGYGVFVQVYEVLSGKLVNQSRVFHNNKVHGLCVENGLFLAYGARSVSVVPWQAILSSKDNSKLEKMCPEWVTSAEFSFDGSAVYLLTSYNKVLCCDLELEVLETRVVYGERAILYSGTITVQSAEKVHINAGTVMDGVFIWDLFSEKNLHHFTGHEGSIFYVTASKNGRFVASCSDDRSIKLWDLESGSLLSTGWGHTARIWNLQFFDNDTKLISASEDCTCRVWEVSQLTGQLTQTDVHEIHLSKNVWGLDVDSRRMIAATSGNDGRIKLTDLRLRTRAGDESQAFSIDDISRCRIDFAANEIVKGFFWLHFGLVVLTSEGQVLKYSDQNSVWSSIFQNQKFKSFSSTTGVQKLNLVVFSNGSGDVLIVKFSQDGTQVLNTLEIAVTELSKVTTCLVESFDGELFIALQSPNPRDALVCVKIDSAPLKLTEKYHLTRPANFNASSILYHDNFLLFGSKFSTLAIFNLRESETSAHVLNRLLPGDTITSVRFVEKSSNDRSLFSVTDREGFYCFVSIDLNNGDSDIVLENKISKGFLEGAFYDPSGDYITYGFKSNYFVMFNETRQFEIMSELCGGSHRQWLFLPNYDPNEFVFVYVKASRINIRKLHSSFVPQTLRDGLHGREIRDLTLRPASYNTRTHVFCSGAEDTTIKLNRIKESGEARTIWTFRKHTSGLQRCKFVSDQYLISSAAREELYLWKLCTDFKSNPYMSIIAVLPTSTKLPDLRIMDFDVKFIENSQDFILVTVYSDSAIKLWHFEHASQKFALIAIGKYETCCLLNVALIPLKETLLLLISPSDGYLVAWDVTKCLNINLRNGKLQDWKPNFSLMPILPDYATRVLVHRAGVKSLQVKSANGSSCLIYTGGDDNAVAISEFAVEEDELSIKGQVLSSDTAGAASTITAVNLLNGGKGLITASVDQRLRYYDVTKNQLTLQDVFYTTNADTGCLDVVSTATGSLLLIGGVGFSAWSLRDVKK
ncbi:LAME_0C08614g1_1 [Lachancea meyersii CBS 8951]|uniref:LAME_0C08614g1_1 n=1 Tax=Lachancea meyersii CBS 8951 TaxID=1266667 RepID=A0A1G4J383_9SACH|nr:LAME_0C08614g1_1 [Lachancea meyersii CBS 8951]